MNHVLEENKPESLNMIITTTISESSYKCIITIRSINRDLYKTELHTKSSLFLWNIFSTLYLYVITIEEAFRWSSILTYFQIGYEYCIKELTTYILKYFSYKLSNGVSSWNSVILQFSFIYFGVWISSVVFGIFGDYYVNKKYCSISVARKLYSTLGK